MDEKIVRLRVSLVAALELLVFFAFYFNYVYNYIVFLPWYLYSSQWSYIFYLGTIAVLLMIGIKKRICFIAAGAVEVFFFFFLEPFYYWSRNSFYMQTIILIVLMLPYVFYMLLMANNKRQQPPPPECGNDSR